MLYSDLISFSLVFFSVPGSHPECHITINHHAILGSSWLGLFFKLSLFLMTFMVLRSAGQTFSRLSLSLGVGYFPHD